jgi:hypothetical protein
MNHIERVVCPVVRGAQYATYCTLFIMANFAVLCAFLITYFVASISAETFTNSECRAVTSSMNACAKRWDSIRLACKSSVTTNTIWPGPCECAYYANDLPCFDEQAFCAAQVWTQVPQWFRDGVSSCIMKDATYTVRANLGSASGVMGNPFTVTDLPGKATRTNVDAGVVTGQPAQTGAGAVMPSPTGVSNVDNREGLSTGAKAGFGVGIGAGVILIAVAAFLIARSRKAPVVGDAEKRVSSPVELHDEEKKIYQLKSESADPKMELSGSLSPRYEMGARTSTWLAEMPTHNSNRNSRQRP